MISAVIQYCHEIVISLIRTDCLSIGSTQKSSRLSQAIGKECRTAHDATKLPVLLPCVDVLDISPG